MLYFAFFLTIILATYAQSKVRNTYRRFAKRENKKGLTGAEVASRLLNNSGIIDVSIKTGGRMLSDHYNPRSKELKLSPGVANSASISAIGIAAHEVGHAVQHSRAYSFFRLRNFIVPVVQSTSRLAPILIIAGLFFNFMQLFYLGVIFFSGAVVFSLITLPVEFDASKRALIMVREYGLADSEEREKIKKVLNAAALTYIASTLMAIVQLLRYIGFARRRD